MVQYRVYVYCSTTFLFLYFFISSRIRHTSCALVTGVQTCALPIFRTSDAPRSSWGQLHSINLGTFPYEDLGASDVLYCTTSHAHFGSKSIPYLDRKSVV